MEITRETRLIDLINFFGDHPELLNATVGSVAAIADANSGNRADGLDPRMGIMEFYNMDYKPFVSESNGVKPGTITQREIALDFWVQINGNTPLASVSRIETANFVNGMRAMRQPNGKPYAEATIRKHTRAISSVLSAAGPSSSTYPHAVGLLQSVPAFPIVHVWVNVTAKTPTLEEYQRLLAACDRAKNMDMTKFYPLSTLRHGQEIDGATWWRALFVVLYNTGLRRGELFAAKWGDIREINRRKYLHIPVEHEKKHLEKQIPLNQAAIDALNTLPNRGPDQLIFGTNGRKTQLFRWRKKISAKANVPLCRTSPHAMRRMCATYVENPQKVLGHTNAATTRNHYTAMQAVLRYMDNLPQPEEDRED